MFALILALVLSGQPKQAEYRVNWPKYRAIKLEQAQELGRYREARGWAYLHPKTQVKLDTRHKTARRRFERRILAVLNG